MGEIEASRRHVVVAGEALIDLIARDEQPLAAVPGGAAYNVARSIGRLGMPCSWLGVLSSDRFGRMLRHHLENDGVGLTLVQTTDLPTTLALAELGSDGSASYRFYFEGTSAPALSAAGFGEPRVGPGALAIGCLGLIFEPMASAIESLVGTLPPDCLLLLDPNARPSATADMRSWRERLARLARRADIVKASVEDLEAFRPGESVSSTAAWLAAQGVRVVVVTSGPGPLLVRLGEAIYHVPVPPVQVVDTVGAGDTFAAAFLGCLVHRGVTRDGLSAAEVLTAAEFAVRASAAVCERVGADPPRIDELGGWPQALA